MLFLAVLLGGAAADAALESFQYRAAEALVVDKNGKPLFRTSRDFLLTVSGNPEGRVLDYDAERRMVRVSDNNPWWIPCDELQPLTNACQAGPSKPRTRGLRLPPQNGGSDGGEAGGPAGRGVPSCPGDPRCPKAG
jgi:hypothetical protein